MGAKSFLPGSTIDTAIVILAARSGEGIEAEYGHLRRLFGDRWRLRRQSLLNVGKRRYDAIEVAVGQRVETIYFEITSFAAPMPGGECR